MKGKCLFCKLTGLIVIIGAVNWGLVGAFDFNLVDTIFGIGSMLSRIVYVVVGLAGLMLLWSYFKVCPKCEQS